MRERRTETELEPGMVLIAPEGTDMSGTWFLLTDPTAPTMLPCLAGEDEDGDLCETDRTAVVSRDELEAFAPLPYVLLPWPRVWVND